MSSEVGSVTWTPRIDGAPSRRLHGAVLRATASLALLLAASACAGPNLCERKVRFFDTQCRGSSVVGRVPLDCEQNLQRCTPGQKQMLDGYISCLEASGQCSLDVMRACQERFPGAVNLLCE